MASSGTSTATAIEFADHWLVADLVSLVMADQCLCLTFANLIICFCLEKQVVPTQQCHHHLHQAEA